jgi:formate dehydrogenase subunit gamma
MAGNRWGAKVLAGMVGSVLALCVSVAQAQSEPKKGQETFDSVLNPNAAEQAKRQREQPLNNSPVWKDVRSERAHTTTAQGVEAGVLMQAGGETWRQRRNNQLIPLGGALFVGVLGLCVLFYLWKGTIPLKTAETGRKLQRFTGFERTVHWTVAITFSILAISGLVLLFGKHVLLPIIGHQLFAWLVILLKSLHNFVGPVFAVATVIMFFTFLKDNWPKLHDFTWMVKGGGLINGEHVASDKYNAGEKVWFWFGLLLLGVLVSGSGFVLNFPNFGQGRATMQLANIVHMASTVLMMTMALGHIYMGTVGMAGAFNAMKTGYVDEAWAKEHHEYWFDDVKKQKVAAGGGTLAVAAPRREET